MTDTRNEIDFTDLSDPNHSATAGQADSSANGDSPVLLTGQNSVSGNGDRQEASAETPQYPIVLTDVPPGEAPDNSMTASEFAAYLTRKRLEANMRGEPGFDDYYVMQQSVYQRVRAKRDPLPHYLVKNEVEVTDSDGNPQGTETKERIFIIVDEAERVWDRPRPRGRSATIQDDSAEGRILRAGKAFVKLEKMEKRNTRLQEQLNKQRALADRYDALLRDLGKTREDAFAAYEADEESKEADTEINDDEE